VTVFVETRKRLDDNMPHQTSGKKRGTANGLLSKQKQAKRARVDGQSDEGTANSRLPKLPRAVQTEKTRPSSALPCTFTVIVGSYEKLLYGIEGTYESNTAVGGGSSESNISPTLKAVFIFPAHVASVRAVAASPDGGKWLATGSSDEIIKVWDLRRRKEVGGLMQHQGSSISRLFGCTPPRCNCMPTI